jgi:hypothetical protein
MSLSMAFPVMLVVEEEIFITAVDRKRHSRDAQAREASLRFHRVKGPVYRHASLD